MVFRRKRYALILGVILAALVASADFYRWVHEVASLEKPENPQAEGIVALTGGSGRRIEAAIRLLEAGAGERLLVSGVHKSVSTTALIETGGGNEDLYACCIDIGRIASSTESNAVETARWVEEHGYKHLILVTSDYHMPRARLWFRRYVPDVEITPYPMQSRIEPRTWWKSWTSFRGLATEWTKYRVTALLLAF
ncbi:YdcF family protein [Ponticaulis profundi]|uniref:YdcF family protein n=1 Tax=Ponticaulis profundi TaxID=2665222 RepID=A0ABW1S7N6_9PROT